MFRTPLDYDAHIRATIERLTADRDASRPGQTPPDSSGPGLRPRIRRRLGIALIRAGERLAGPNSRSPRPTTSRPAASSRAGA